MPKLLQFSYSSSNFMLNGVPIFIAIVFIIVFGIIIFTAIKGLSVWSTNNRAPREQQRAFVLTKRTEVRHRSGNNNNGTATNYFVTFESTNGNRKEFQVNGKEYGLVAEGDIGTLDFQGTRFHSFSREDQ